MTIKKITRNTFSKIDLDYFNRQQQVTRMYVKRDGNYVLEEHQVVMDWTVDKKREVARDLLDPDYISYLALEGDVIVGFMSLVKQKVADRMILDLIQVDKKHRGKGIGRRLWEKAVEEARINRAKELYISAFPAEETINFYKAMGANITNDPIISIANEEPYDLQLSCIVQ